MPLLPLRPPGAPTATPLFRRPPERSSAPCSRGLRPKPDAPHPVAWPAVSRLPSAHPNLVSARLSQTRRHPPITPRRRACVAVWGATGGAARRQRPAAVRGGPPFWPHRGGAHASRRPLRHTAGRPRSAGASPYPPPLRASWRAAPANGSLFIRPPVAAVRVSQLAPQRGLRMCLCLHPVSAPFRSQRACWRGQRRAGRARSPATPSPGALAAGRGDC